MQPLDDEGLGLLIRREATRHQAPDALAARILGQVRSASPPASQPLRATRQPAVWRWLQSVAMFGAGAATAWGVALSLLVVPAPDPMDEAVAASHVRSLMGAHLADVASSDRHTVKPWFAGKLDFSPPVIDLAAEGLPLVGGRLDYLQGRAVAALVYRSGEHVINLFIWPAADSSLVAPRPSAWRGYNLVHWTQAGMQVWAVSDMNPDELKSFAALWRGHMAAPQSSIP